MNQISKLARISKCVHMGIGNVIGENVYIGENVSLGNNNKIYPNTRIYPNVEIGNDNVFLEDNSIGEHPISSTEVFTKKKYNGVSIGNNNLFHSENRIFGGTSGKTRIGNNNKILHHVHIGHDTNITNNVHIYPNTIISGHCVFLPYSGIGIQSAIHQHTIIGGYSFSGMLSAVVKHTFPFYTYIGNKTTRFNTKRCPENIEQYMSSIDLLRCNYKNMSEYELFNSIQQYPDEIQTPLKEFFQHINNN